MQCWVGYANNVSTLNCMDNVKSDYGNRKDNNYGDSIFYAHELRKIKREFTVKIVRLAGFF